MSGTKLLPGGSALIISSLYSTARAVVVTGGFKLGMMMALPKCLALRHNLRNITSNTRRAPPKTKQQLRSDEPVWHYSLEDTAFTKVEVPVVGM